ncbi:MAG: MauE/DoxX family redox-associated membrane protein [Ilumatobacteraceae bacterium]
MGRSAWGVMASVLVALVLLVAGVSKLAAPAAWRSQSEGLGVPWVLARPMPLVELGLGALLMVQLQRHAVAWCAVVLLAVFTGLLLLRLAQGRRPPCACFGSLSSRPIGARHLARNAALLALATLAATL